MYDESMTLECQRGRCDGCPENDSDYCACVCHIPDVIDQDESDALASAFYERFYAS